MGYKESEVGKIPVHWEIRQLSEIGEIVSGGTPNTKIEEYWNGNIPWITPKDLSGFTDRYIYSGERNITELGLENSSAKLLPRNTVLFSSRAPIGYVALAGDNLATNQGFKSIICDDKKAYPLFIYYLLKSKKNDIENIAGGSTFKEVSGKVMKEFKVQIPPLTEQKAIANILSTLDEKIETNNQINEKLEEMAQALFKHWFVDFEFPNENGKPYKSSGGEMVESELGMIPKGWKVSKLSELITLYDSKRIPLSKNERDKREKIYPYYGASSLMDYVDDYIFDGVYVLLGEDGTVIDELGYPILQYVWGKFWVNNHAHVIKGKNDYSEEFVYMLLKNTNVSSAVTGAVQLKINQKNLKNLSVVIPEDTDLIKQFSGILNYQFSIIRNNSDQNKVLTSIRDNLLPKLMSGEIRVPLDDEVLSEKN